MNRKIPIVMDIISKYGSFSKPFVNYFLEYGRINTPCKYYLLTLKYIWNGNYNSALSTLEKGLNLCNDNKTLYFIFLSQKLLILKKLKRDQEADKLFLKLKKDFYKIPKYARKIASSSLLNSYSDISKFRIWGKIYEEDNSAKTFILIGKAKEEIEKNNFKKGIKLYLDAFKTAKSIPHPVGIINSLNNASWFLKESHPKISLILSNKLSYFLGLYREDMDRFLYALDTIFKIQRLNSDPGILETADILTSLEKYLNKLNLPSEKLKYYKETIEQAKDFKFSHKKSTNIRKISLNNNFDINNIFHYISQLSNEDKIILFVSSFMSLFNRKKIFPYITHNIAILFEYFSKDWNNFLLNSKDNWEILRFISFMGENIHPFFLARRELAFNFLKNLNDKYRNIFINFYLSLSEEEKEMMDIFIRNYVRYNREWELKLSHIPHIDNLIKAFHLKENPSLLSIFSFEKRERKRFLRIIENLNIA